MQEKELQKMSDQMGTDEGLAQLVQALQHQQMQKAAGSEYSSKKKPKPRKVHKGRKAASQTGGEEADITEQIQEYKEENNKEIMRLLEGRRG